MDCSMNCAAKSCYTDNSVTGRSLVGGATSGSSMTIELCGSYCKGLSFSYFEVEYADEVCSMSLLVLHMIRELSYQGSILEQQIDNSGTC